MDVSKNISIFEVEGITFLQIFATLYPTAAVEERNSQLNCFESPQHDIKNSS
jgi:hypothetical protein